MIFYICCYYRYEKIEYKYTVEDVAKMVNVKPETVRRWSREKRIKYLKLPGEKGRLPFLISET